MATDKEVKSYKVTVLPGLGTIKANSIYYVRPTPTSDVSVFITDIQGAPHPIKDLTVGLGLQTLTSADGTIIVTGSNNVTIKVAPALVALINSALQSGDNISELVNDANYITLGDIPVQPTNLGTTISPTQIIITNDNGTDATLPLATNINSGLLSPTEKITIATAVQPGDLGATAFSNDYNHLDNLPNIPEISQDSVGMILVDSATIDFTYSDGIPSITADIQANSITANELSNTINISEFVNDEGFIDHADLSYIASPTTGTIVSDVGTDAIIPLVDNTNSGLQSPLDKIKLDGIESGAQVNDLETLTSTGGTINVGANISKNINLEVVQATEIQLGGGEIVTQSVIEDETTTNDTEIVTAKKWWFGFNRATLLAWTWNLKQTFTTAPRFSSTIANTVPYIDASKDLISSSVTPTELGYVSGVTSSIQTQLNGKEPTITASGNVTDFWSGIKTFRDLATDVRAVVLTGFNSAITWARVTTSSTIQDAISLLQKQSNYLQATRFISGTGVTINADPTKFNIQVVGEIVDPITFLPTAINVNLTAVTTTFIATQVESYVWIDSAGSIIQSLTPPLPTDYDTIVGFWVLIHANLTTINIINSFPVYADGVNTKVSQILSFIGFSKFPNTNIASIGTTGTRITHTGGLSIKLGLGNTTKRPVTMLIGAVDPSNMEMRHRNGVQSTGVQNIDVTNYNPTGSTVSALGNNRFGVHKIWKFASGLIRIQYGQKEYQTYSEAVVGLGVDIFSDEGNAFRNGLHIGWLVFKKNTSWGSGGSGTDGVDFKFVDVASNGSVGGIIPTLQAGYDVSTQPQILTSLAKGAFQVQGGSGTDTDNIWEGKNNAGTITSYIKANGLSTFGSGEKAIYVSYPTWNLTVLNTWRTWGRSVTMMNIDSNQSMGTGATPTLSGTTGYSDSNYFLVKDASALSKMTLTVRENIAASVTVELFVKSFDLTAVGRGNETNGQVLIQEVINLGSLGTNFHKDNFTIASHTLNATSIIHFFYRITSGTGVTIQGVHLKLNFT